MKEEDAWKLEKPNSPESSAFTSKVSPDHITLEPIVLGIPSARCSTGLSWQVETFVQRDTSESLRLGRSQVFRTAPTRYLIVE